MCNKKKLFKLLYFLDFEHYAETGRSVTGFEYEAWPMGPVPPELDRRIKAEDSSLLEFVEIEHESGKRDYKRISFIPKKKFDEKYFSRRQLRMLANIADRFAMMTGTEMEEFTHREGMPWDRVYNLEANKDGQIPFEYELDKLSQIEKEVVLGMAEERKDFIQNYG